MADTAYELAQAMFADYGLPDSLMQKIYQQILVGVTGNELLTWFRQQPEYKAMFPGIEELREQGSALGAEANYNQYRQQALTLAKQWGIPSGLYDSPQKIAESMLGHVSIDELSTRYQMAASAAYTMPQEVRDVLADTYGASPGDIVGFYLNADDALPILERNYQAAQVMGAARQAGVGVSQGLGEDLAQRGVSFQQAQQGFQQVSGLRALDAGLGAAETTTEAERVEGVFGSDEAARRRMERVTASRQAQFQGGGGAASGSGGSSGLGESRSR